LRSQVGETTLQGKGVFVSNNTASTLKGNQVSGLRREKHVPANQTKPTPRKRIIEKESREHWRRERPKEGCVGRGGETKVAKD